MFVSALSFSWRVSPPNVSYQAGTAQRKAAAPKPGYNDTKLASTKLTFSGVTFQSKTSRKRRCAL